MVTRFAANPTALFSETGLANGTQWAVTVNGTIHASNTSTISVALPPGDYQYNVSNVSRYYPSPFQGIVVLKGSNVTTVPIQFSQTLFGVSFEETGLPVGTTWGVTVSNGTHSTLYFAQAISATRSYLSLTEPNGLYNYSVSGVPGYHLAAGTNRSGIFVVHGGSTVAAALPFAVTIVTYNVTFSQVGLPSSSIWGVAVNGSLYFQPATSSIVIPLPNGSYPYRIADVPGWHQSTMNYSGNLTVAGAPINVPALLFQPFAWNVSLTEAGLPSGQSWSAYLGGTLLVATAPNPIETTLPNGTYSLTIGGIAGWNQTTLPYSGGTVSVNGTPLTLGPLVWNPVDYSVRWTETGLPNGTSWSVSVEGSLYVGVAPNPIAVSLPNGTYTYSLGGIAGWMVTGSSTGSVMVSGYPSSISVTFHQVTYPVVFTETGLPSGVTWGVVVNGTLYAAPAGSPVETYLPNGTFTYAVQDVPGWHQNTVPYGTQTEQQTPLGFSEALSFEQVVYPVTFQEVGLPSGNWSIVINGTTETAPTGTPIVGMLPNGTFTYEIRDVPGWHQTTLPYSGTGQVSGT
ncbi:MAG: hypothetical protein QXG65_04760, partial [Thermoplasmata archaeon]